MRSSRAAASRAAASASATVPRSATRPPAAAIRCRDVLGGEAPDALVRGRRTRRRRSARARPTTPSRSLFDDTASTTCIRSQVKDSASARARAVRTAGVVGAVHDEQRAARHHLEAAGDPERPDRRPGRVGVERVPQHGLDRDDRRRHVPHRVLAEHREEELLVRGRARLRRGTPARPTAGRRAAASQSRPSSRSGRPHLVRRAPRSRPAPRSGCSRTTTILPGLMIPAFSVATSRTVEPSSGWSSPTSPITATSPAIEVRRVPRPAHPDLEHRRAPRACRRTTGTRAP